MIQRGERFRFALKSCQPIRIEMEGGWQNLQRDVTIKFRIACPIDLAHPAGTKGRENFIRAEADAGVERQDVPELS